MKNTSKLLLLTMLIAVTAIIGCGPTEVPPVEDTTANHKGAITADETWSADKIHFLEGRVWVEDGATLTIEPGTIIKGKTGTEANASALIIARGGMINAAGTADKPIIFTSELDNIQLGEKMGTNLTEADRGKWGGLIILGKAKISAEDGDTEARIEGIPATESYGLFGGTEDADNSGTLTYVSVRFGGALLGEGNEINGITLGGVGSGTTIHHVEVVANVDDGIEWFGGTVNVSHAIVAYQGDDALDIDMNYAGTVDNFTVIQGGDTDEGLEIDGPEGTTYTTGKFVLKNGTLISEDGNGSGADLKSKAQGTITNCYFTGYSKFVKVRSSWSDTTNCVPKTDAASNVLSGDLIINNNDIYSATATLTVNDIANLYTGSCDECTCPANAEGGLDSYISGAGNNVTGSSSYGANPSEFAGWSWVAINGKI